ncbi:MAG TPA: hypothetical protein VEZ55_11540 [Chitinophagaceae bacterium]|jgi:hypothetical protein|nr:hypothetical protein [Chitinophagaceae bacterium]
MNLQLFLNNQFIGSIPIDKNSISDPLYISLKRTELEIKYTKAIDTCPASPTFYIAAHSSMNERRKSIAQKDQC